MPKKTTEKKNNDALKDALLLATLPYVPELGWSRAALAAGADVAGATEARAQTLFPAGDVDLIAHFIDWADRRMLAGLAKAKLEKLKVRERIALAVRLRLEAITPYKSQEKQAMLVLARPWHAPMALKALYHTVDEMWRAAGDTATDFNFYTKRALLAGVFTSTLIFFLNDESKGHEKSWAYLAARIENVMQVGKLTGRLKEKVAGLKEKAQRRAA